MNKLLIALIIAALATSGCSKKVKEQKTAEAEDKSQVEAQANKADEQEREAGITGTDDSVKHKVLSFNLEGLNDRGEKKWDVNGESAEAISEDKVELDNIVAKAYGEEAEAVITADKGVYDKTKNNVTLQQNVKAVIESTDNFNGNFVDFSGKTGAKDTADETGPNIPKQKTKTTITCDGEVQFDYEKNVAFFLKNVHVISKDGSIIADKITVHLDPDTKQVSEIIAEGNVKIMRGENITYSKRATYNAITKKVSLTGRPKLVIYQDGDDVNTNFMGDLGKM